MKKLILMLVLASMVLGLASVACAEDPISWFCTINMNGQTFSSDVGKAVFDLGKLQSWDLSYTGGATISPMGLGTATLTGGYLLNNIEPGYIWSFAFSKTGLDNSWENLTPLIQTFSASNGKSETRDATMAWNQPIEARYVRIQHNETLSTTVPASATGTAAMTLTSVPEPGTVLASMSLLAPAGMLFRRKRSK